jgi:hypothetical protein
MSRDGSAEIIVHEADEPNPIADLFDADALTGEDQAEIDLVPIEAWWRVPASDVRSASRSEMAADWPSDRVGASAATGHPVPGRGFWRLWRKLELGTTALRSYDVTRGIGARPKQRSNRRTRRNCLRSRERASAALHSGRSRDRSQDPPLGNLWSAERCRRGLP